METAAWARVGVALCNELRNATSAKVGDRLAYSCNH